MAYIVILLCIEAVANIARINKYVTRCLKKNRYQPVTCRIGYPPFGL